MLVYIFVSIIGEAYLLRGSMTESQWKGWNAYIKDYCSTALFQDLWFDGTPPRIGWRNQFSGGFEDYIEHTFVRLGVLEANNPPSASSRRFRWLHRTISSVRRS